MRNLLYILILISLKSFGSDSPYPIIVHLGEDLEEKSIHDSPITYLKCWDDKGNFHNENCDRDVTSCSIENYFPHGNMIPIKINPQLNKEISETLYVQVEGLREWNSNVQMFGKTPWSVFRSAPLGANVTVYSGDFGYKHNIYGRFKVPANGILNITSVLPAYQEVTFVKGENWAENTEMHVEFFERESLSTNSQRQAKFTLAEGEYIYVVSSHIDKKSLQYRGKIKIPKVPLSGKSDPINIPIDFAKLKDVSGKRNQHATLRWHENTLGYNLGGPGYENPQLFYGFANISSIKINSSKDITSAFQIVEGQLKLTKKPDFEAAVKDSPIYKIQIEGECAKHFARNQKVSYEVRNKPAGGIIGEIKIYDTPAGMISDFKDISGKVSRIKSNIESPANTFYIQTKTTIGKDANLGPGPWGTEAWVTAPYSPLFGKRIFYFTGNNGKEIFQYLKYPDGSIYKRALVNDELTPDDLFSGEISEASKSELLDEQGFIKKEIHSISDYPQEKGITPYLVDLANYEITIKNQNPVTKDIYESPNPQSKLLGTIESSIVDGKIKTFFKATSQSKPQKIESDFYQGRCGSSNHYSALMNVIDTNLNFSKIGTGPWGKSAWVRTKRWAITDENLPVKFQHGDGYLEKIYMRESEDKISLSLDYQNGSSHSTVDIKSIYENGKLKYKPYCNEVKLKNLPVGYEPRYVSLIPRSFEESVSKMGCDVYKDPYHSESEEEKISKVPDSNCQITKSSCDLYLTPDRRKSKSSLKISFPMMSGRIIYLASKHQLNPLAFEFRNQDHYTLNEVAKPQFPEIYLLKYPEPKPLNVTFGKPFSVTPPDALEISYHQQKLSNSDKEIKIEKPKSVQAVKFVFGNFSSPPDRIRLLLHHQHLIDFTSKYSYNLNFSKGRYELKFYADINGESQIATKEFKIDKISTETLVVKVDENEFKPSTESRIFMSYETFYDFISIQGGGNSSNLSNLKSLTIESDTTKDLTKHVRIDDRGVLMIRPELKEEFHRIVETHGGELHLSGTCQSSKILPLSHRIPVYSTNINSSENKIGDLISVYDTSHHDGSITIKFADNDGNESTFTPNLYSGHCEPLDNKHLHIHQVVEHSGDWSNLGDGPWGEKAWINVESEEIFGSKLEFKFSEEFNQVGFEKDENGDIRFKNGEHKKRFDLEDIIGPDGKMKFSVSCEMGC